MTAIDSSSTKQPFGWVIGKGETTYLGVKGVSYQIRMSPTKDDPLDLVTVFFKTVENQDDTVDHLTLLKGMRSLRKHEKKDELLAVNNKVELNKKLSTASALCVKVTMPVDKKRYKIGLKEHAQVNIQAKADELRDEDNMPPILKSLDQINRGEKPTSKRKSKKLKSAPEQPLAPISLGPPRKKPLPDKELLRILQAMNKEYEAAKSALDKHTSKSMIPGVAFVMNACASSMPGNNEYKTALMRAGTAAQSIRDKLNIQGNKDLPLTREEERKVLDKIQRLKWDINRNKSLPPK